MSNKYLIIAAITNGNNVNPLVSFVDNAQDYTGLLRSLYNGNGLEIYEFENVNDNQIKFANSFRRSMQKGKPSMNLDSFLIQLNELGRKNVS